MNKFIFILSSLLLLSSQAYAGYCSTKNWNTGKALYKKYEDRYNVQVDKFNDALEIYNDFGFLWKQYSIKAFSKLWGLEDELIKQTVEMQKEFAFVEIKKLEKLKRKLRTIETGLDKSRNLWSKLAEYCYDEDNYDSYKAGRNNMRDSIRTIKALNALTERTEKFRLKYLKEVEFINNSKDYFEANCDCEK